VINVSNFTTQNNPPWRLAERAGPAGLKQPRAPARAATERAAAARFGRTLGIAGRVLMSWLAAIPRRLGDRLFAMNDTEAYWRGWQIIKTRGGLARRYRDPRFVTLAECPKCRGAGVTTGGTGATAGGTADLPCLPCLGTGTIGAATSWCSR
jgi:hypothetical protein